jgi:hypothetical protein
VCEESHSEYLTELDFGVKTACVDALTHRETTRDPPATSGPISLIKRSVKLFVKMLLVTARLFVLFFIPWNKKYCDSLFVSCYAYKCHTHVLT